MTPHPENATLAAFIDGKLAGAERQRVVEHLADCSECYEVFVGTARFLEEEGKGGVIQWPVARRQWWRRRGGMAATAAGVAAVALLVLVQGRTAPPSSAAVLAAALSEEAAQAAPLGGWGAGLAFSPSSDGDAAAPWVGAQFLEIHTALQAGQPETAAAAAAGLAGALVELGRAGDGAAARRLAEALAAGRRTDDASRDTERLARRLARGFPPKQLAYGAWADASRRAAEVSDASFFAGAAYRQARQAVDEQALPPAARDLLAKIDRALADGLDRPPAGPDPLVRGGGRGEGGDLAVAFEQLIFIER